MDEHNRLGRAAVELEDYLLHVIGEAQSVARRFPQPQSFRPRSLAQQQALNPAYASAVGYRNELRAFSRRLPEEMHALLRELQTLAKDANLRLNDLGRYGDAAPRSQSMTCSHSSSAFSMQSVGG